MGRDLTPGPLAAIDRWPVPHAAAAVVGPTGVLASTGDPDRAFRLASVTKLLTAMACLVAIEEETLELGAAAGPPGSTVEHLLAHASGLGFDTGMLAPPGRKRIYSNTGYEALSAHVAEQAGMPFGDYLGAAVLLPLGMAGADLRDGSAAHGAWATLADVTRFTRELLAPTLVASSTLGAATSVHFPGLDGMLPGIGPQRPLDWGLGFEIRDHKSPHWTGATNGPGTYGHFGGSGTFLWVDPSLGVGCIVLTDREFGPWALEAWPALSDAVVAWVRGP